MFPFHFYAYHPKSKQLLLLTDKQADILNDFTDVFIQAQKVFQIANGRRWTPTDSLPFPVDFDMKAYDRVARFVNLQHPIRNKLFDIFHVDVSNEEFDDYLNRRFP